MILTMKLTIISIILIEINTSDGTDQILEGVYQILDPVAKVGNGFGKANIYLELEMLAYKET